MRIKIIGIVIVAAIIAVFGFNGEIFNNLNAFATENNSAQEDNRDSQEDASNLIAANVSRRINALYKKIIGSLMQENADLKTNLSKLKNFNAWLEKKAKTLYLKAQGIEQMKKDFTGFNKLLEKLNKENAALKKENDNLEQCIRALEEISRKEKASLNQELGAAYTKAKLFPLAIDAYLKSLSLNPDNAELHYNLGLLYQHSEENTKKSLYHFKKYLELKPNAKNKKEVEYLIAVLTESPSSF